MPLEGQQHDADMSSERLLGDADSVPAPRGSERAARSTQTSSSSIDLEFLRGVMRLVRRASAGSAPESPAGSVNGGSFATRVRPYLLLLLFASVQVYNIAGFYSVLVPSLFYAALTSEASGSHADATQAIDTEQLKHAVISAVQYLSAVVVAKAVMTVLSEFMALQWRESLTLQLQSRYLRGGVFYQLAAGWPHIDNPDQRMSAEVGFWATETAALFVTGAPLALAPLPLIFSYTSEKSLRGTGSQAVFNVAYYTYKTRVLIGSWFGPSMIYLYAVCSLTTTKLVANPIASVTAAAEAAEGNYRRQLVNLNASAESVAMSGDATPEAAILSSDLATLLRLRGRIVVLRFFLNLLVYFMDYAGSVVNYLILATAVVAGAPH